MSSVYSNLKFLHYPDQLDALRESRVVAPVHVRIKPYNHCNHDCWYCAYRVSNLELGQDIDYSDTLPETKMVEIADDLIAMGVKAVTFSGGGEPLLYKPLPRIVEQLARGGTRIASLTNGSNLKGRMAEAFAEHGTWIRVSVDAWDDASYAKSRKIKDGSFTKLLENLRNFTSLGSRCTLGISFIISQDNDQHIFDACSAFKDAGVNHVKLTGVVTSNSVDENNVYHDKIKDRVHSEIDRAKALNDDNFRIVNHYHELEDRFQKDYSSCPFLQFLTVIGADGGVYSCQDKAFTSGGLLGSIRDQSFKDFWYSQQNKLAMHAINPAKDCVHHCIAHGKNLAILDLLELDPDHASFV